MSELGQKYESAILVKSFIYSKTFWIGGMAPIAIAVIDAVTSGADWRQAVMAGLGAISVLLRKLTTKGMGFSLEKERVEIK